MTVRSRAKGIDCRRQPVRASKASQIALLLDHYKVEGAARNITKSWKNPR